MWTRQLIKQRAKEALKGSYWKAFLVSLLIGLLGGGQQPPFNFSWNFGSKRQPQMIHGMTTHNDLILLIIIIFVVLLVILFVMALRIFLGYPLEVGARRYFIQAAQLDANMNNLGYAFEKGRYFNIIKAMFWRGFLNFLWYLLLFIPGIVKSYAYSMVPYILAENPDIGANRAITLSKKMTQGHKFKMLILDLSFIGWYLLGILALFIGVLFVYPYVNATKAELYLILRQGFLAD